MSSPAIRAGAAPRLARCLALLPMLALVAVLALPMLAPLRAWAEPGDPAALAPTPSGSASPSASPGSTPGSTPVGAATSPIQVDVVAISPATPDAANAEQQVTVSAVLLNTSGAAFTDVRILVERGAPIVQRGLLHDAMTTAPSTQQVATDPLQLPAPLPAGGQVSVTYQTTPEQLCMCFTGDYPYALVAEARTGNGAFREAGRAPILIPSFLEAPSSPLTASWVWPLIDQPHLAGSGSLFVDDALAASVRANGRLDRALQVLEGVTGTVRMTVVLDPALIDELLVMTEGYTVRGESGGSSEPTTGTGGPAADAWLARLKAIAGEHDIVLTGYADPDLASLATAGLPVPELMSADLAARVATALGVPYRTDLAWPVGETLTPAGADAVRGAGATTVLLRDTSFTGGTQPDPAGEVRDLSDSALASLTAPGSSTAAAGDAVVLDSSLLRRVDEATDRTMVRAAGVPAPSAPGAPAAQTASVRTQALLAELAMWPLHSAAAGGFVALAPDRHVDPNVAGATAAIKATAETSWISVRTVRDAVAEALRQERGGLGAARAGGLDGSIMAAARAAIEQQGTAAQLLAPQTARAVLSGPLANLQRAVSSAWRSDPRPGRDYAKLALSGAEAVTDGVSVVTPDNASYSLSSENSPLILTVRNDLQYPVRVSLLVVPASASVTGFRADDIGIQTIEANTARTLKIPAHFERSGRFEVHAVLSTPEGTALGDPVRLSVLCTAYGTVALSITIVAFALLLLLLLFRAARGLRRRRMAT